MDKNKNAKIMSEEERQELLVKIGDIKNEISELEGYIEDRYADEYNTEEDIDPIEAYYSSPEGQVQLLVEEEQELEQKLFEDDYWRKNIEYTKSYKNSLRDYSAGNVISDTNCDVSQDVFMRKGVAKTISDVLCKAQTKGPFNIGILGRWGQGKTTFIEYIKESILENANASRIRMIDYNASEYDEQEKIWANLANSLFEEYEKNVWFAKIKFYISKIKSELRAYEEKLLLNALIIVVIFLLTIISKGLFSLKNILGYFTGATIGVGAGIIAIAKIAIPLFKSAISSTVPLSNKIIGKMKLPSYVNVLGKRAEIASDLNVLLDAWLKGENDKIVIFVDELDRCTEKGIVEFFQSIQLLISNRKICFVFAIDAVCLKNAFIKCKNLSDEDVEQYLNHFLDKYLSVVVPLSNVMDYSDYIENILSYIKPTEQKYCFTKDEVDTIKRCINTMPNSLMTPRKVKKIINILILLKEHCVKNINKNYAIKFEELVTWYIFAFVYREEAGCILSIYKENIKYAPLGRFMNKSNVKIIEEQPRCKKYVLYMKDYSMSDINLYNYISLMFMPEVNY